MKKAWRSCASRSAGGHAPGTKKYLETRKLMEDSITGDRAGFSAQAQGEDIQIVHNEGMFLLGKKVGG